MWGGRFSPTVLTLPFAVEPVSRRRRHRRRRDRRRSSPGTRTRTRSMCFSVVHRARATVDRRRRLRLRLRRRRDVRARVPRVFLCESRRPSAGRRPVVSLSLSLTRGARPRGSASGACVSFLFRLSRRLFFFFFLSFSPPSGRLRVRSLSSACHRIHGRYSVARPPDSVPGPRIRSTRRAARLTVIFRLFFFWGGGLRPRRDSRRVRRFCFFVVDMFFFF